MVASRTGLAAIALLAAFASPSAFAQDAAPEVDLAQPSAEAMALWDAGDVQSAMALVDTEVGACVQQAGGDNAELLAMARCTELFLIAQQLLFQTGDYADSVEIGTVVIDLSRAAFGENTDLEALGHLFKGRALLALSRVDEAAPELEAALAIARLIYAGNDPELTPYLSGLADAALVLERNAQALALLQEAIPLETDPVFLAHMRLQYGIVLTVSDDTEGGLREARTAAAEFARLLGPDSDRAIEARVRIAGALVRIERPDEAIAMMTRDIPLLEERDGLKYLLAEALRIRGTALADKSEWIAALPLLERAATLAGEVYGGDTKLVVDMTAIVGDVREMAVLQREGQDEFPLPPAFWEAYYGGRFAEAEAIFEPLGRACIAKFSPDEPDPAKLEPCLTLLVAGGLTYSSLNRLELGRTFAELAVAVAEIHYDDPSQELGIALMARGTVLQQGGQTQASIAPLGRAIPMLDSDPDIQVGPMIRLASAYVQAGQPERSLELLGRAKATPGSPATRLTLAQVEAETLVALGRVAEAETMLRVVIADSPEALETSKLNVELALGQVLTAGFKYEEATALLEALAPRMRAAFGEHPVTARALDSLGMAYLRAGRARDGVDVFRQALTITRALVGEDNPLAGLAYNNLGLALLQTGEGEEAAASFIRAVEILQSQEPVNMDWFAVAALNLGNMAQITDAPEAALDLADSLLKAIEDQEGTEFLEARVRSARAAALLDLGRHDDAIADIAIAWDLASRLPGLRDLAAGAATIRARAEAARGNASAAREWFVRATALASDVFSETDANRMTILYLYSIFELDLGGELATARTLLRHATEGSLIRIAGYDDFDAGAQREMRSLGLFFRDQVETAWRLSSAR